MDKLDVMTPQKTWLTDILLLCLLIGSAFAFMLGSRPLSVPDESRYSEIPREMLVSHNFITPRVNGIKYFEKPPLVYWIQAASLNTFGINQWAARIPDALMALLGCLGTYFTARKLYDRKTGIFSAIILGSSLLYFALARVVTLDMTVSVLLSLAFFSFILGAQKNPRYYYWLYIFSALAVLTKGLIGIIFPGSVIFLWLLFSKRWAILKECHLFSGTLIFLAIALPWHILIQHQNPEFFHYYFIRQQFSRYFTMVANRYQPPWYFLPILILGLFPWTGFLWGAFQKIKRNNDGDLFFLITVLFVFIFFSLSHSKLVPYILPCFPPIAILMGKYFAHDPQKNSRSFSIGLITTAVISVALIIALPIAVRPAITTNFAMAKAGSQFMMAILACNLLTLYIFRKDFIKFFISQCIITTLFLFSICATLPAIYMDSIKPLALKIKPFLTPQTIVATYHFYYQDLPFYLNRTVSIVSWAGELEFGEKHSAHKDFLITDETLWQDWQSTKTVYLFVPDKFYKTIVKLPYHFYPVIKGKQDEILTNHLDSAL